jgi:large subunit ribosomal protein L31
MQAYSMKKNIHPEYFPNATITCACGNIIKTGSTKPEMHIEICSACHPFYTGKKKVIDTTGRVDRFKKRMEKTVNILETAEQAKKALAAKKAKEKAKETAKKTKSKKKEMVTIIKK